MKKILTTIAIALSLSSASAKSTNDTTLWKVDYYTLKNKGLYWNQKPDSSVTKMNFFNNPEMERTESTFYMSSFYENNQVIVSFFIIRKKQK